MPSIVAVSVRNCAIASNTFAAMSLSWLMSIEVNASDVATANDATANRRSRNRSFILVKFTVYSLQFTVYRSEGFRHKDFHPLTVNR